LSTNERNGIFSLGEEKMAEHDTSEPILVLVRRGRKNRGFSVSPVEDVSDAASCADEKEIGEVIVEMLDDPKQPRVNINELLAAAAGAPPTRTTEGANDDDDDDDDEDEDEYEDEDEGASPIDEVLGGEGDLADKAIIWGLSSLLNKGRNMSSSKVTDTRSRKKKKKKKKKKKDR